MRMMSRLFSKTISARDAAATLAGRKFTCMHLKYFEAGVEGDGVLKLKGLQIVSYALV